MNMDMFPIKAANGSGVFTLIFSLAFWFVFAVVVGLGLSIGWR